MGENRPFLFVGYTEEDFTSLDKAPSLRAGRGVPGAKDPIRAAHPAFTLGGFSLGETLAIEMASQLRSDGRQVSLLVLVDPPNPSYLGPRDPLTPKLK